MDTKTREQYLRGKPPRHRLTVPNHTIKTLARKLAFEAQRGQKPKRKAAKKPKKAKKGKPPKYKRLDEKDRVLIATLIGLGLKDAEIARQVGCHRSTIGYERKKNTSQRGYRPKYAQRKADGRVKAKASARRKFTPEQWKEAKEKLAKDGWTFEQTSERAKREGRDFVCRETLYKEYHARQRLVALGKSQEILPVLPRGHRKRHKRGKSYANAGRGRIPDRVDIDERPKSVENRARAGHWEGDLINGLRGTGNLVTVVERMSRFTLVGYSATKETDAVMAVFKALLSGLPQEMVRTLTLDNGKEYSKFKVLVQECGLAVFFAKPYHSWERGTNENRNGVVRIVLPKGSRFDSITREQMERIDRLLNDRPLRCLGWRTPREVFMARLQYRLKAA